MSTTEINELERQEDELMLKRIAGKPQHIEINERTLEAYREEFAKKGLVIEQHKDYPQDDYYQIAKLKEFDRLVDPSQGIRKVIGAMTRQPVTIFNKQGKPEVKDALYYYGEYYGQDKHGNDLGAHFQEGWFKKPKLVFTSTDPANPYDPKTGERRGEYKQSGTVYEHYIFLPEKKEDRVKFLNDIVQKATGTYTGNLQQGGHLSYRNPSPNNDRSGTHGGSFNWDVFSTLSIEELGELQNKRYYKDQKGILRDKDNVPVEYDPPTGKLESTDKR